MERIEPRFDWEAPSVDTVDAREILEGVEFGCFSF